MQRFVKIPDIPLKVLLTLAVIGLAFTVHRSETPFASISFPQGIQNFSIDRYELLYVADANGDIHKIDTLGNKLLTWSPQKKAEVTLMEAWRNVNVMLFYRNFQEIILLDRFLADNSTSKLNNNNIGFARLATQSSDNNLWIVDESDYSLKKYNLTYNKIDFSTSLDLIIDPEQYDLYYLREYQNQVYLIDRNQGILVFDIMGNYKNKIPAKGITFSNFLNDEVYYSQNDSIYFVNLYTYKRRQKALPAKGSKAVLTGSKVMYLIYDKKVDLFQYQP